MNRKRLPNNISMKQSWLHFRSSKTLKASRSSYHKLSSKHVPTRKAVTLHRMSRSFDDSYEEKTVSSSQSQQDFIEMLSQVQGRRYDNQRSPYPSPTLSKQDSIDYTMNNGTVNFVDGNGSKHDVLSGEGATILEERNDSIHSCSSDSLTVINPVSPAHLSSNTGVPPGSPSLKPNRRSVEALRTLLKTEEGPFPLIINPPDGGYWVKNGEYSGSKGSDGVWRAPEIDTEHFRVETDNTSLMYGCHFVGKSHRNFYATESPLGPVIFSLMFDTASSFDPMIRMILRTQTETIYKVYPSAQLSRKLEPEEYFSIMSAHLNDPVNVRIENLKKVQHPNASELIQKFDEHCVAKQHKIGVIYQKYGQTTEEEMFCNNDHSPAFKEFLELLGDTVTLKGFEKYRGGLDNIHNQTGEKSVYTEFQGQEIMFHVSTLLPFDPSDRQQVARKRHIGNDIVLVVFQDHNTPYSPDCVRSKFLHSHIVVQAEQPCTENTVYKVAVAAKDQVPDFAPPLPTPAVFEKGNDFKEWLLTKILNAESQCHKAPDFRRLAYRTRTQLFTHLMKDLSTNMNDSIDSPVSTIEKRKSLAFAESFDSSESPRRRRKTFGSIFPRRKVSSVTPSPKLSPRKSSTIDKPQKISKPSKKFTASTPDLTKISNSEDDSLSTGSQTMERRKVEKGKGQSKSRRFTLHGRSRKKSQQVMKSIGGAAEEEVLSRHDKNGGYGYQQAMFSSDESSMMTSLNWSVPSDLPAVVNQQMSMMVPSGPTSLENLTINLEPEDEEGEQPTNLDRNRCASNPDIVDNKRRSRRIRPRIPAEFYSVTDIQRSPGSAGPKTCDVSIQVDSKQVFTFPTPPNSVSPTLPSEFAQLLTSPSHLHQHMSLLPPIQNKQHHHQQHHAARILVDQNVQDSLASHHSSTNSLDNRHSGGSFPFVPEEDEEMPDEESREVKKSPLRNAMMSSSSATAVIQEEDDEFLIESGDSSEDIERDITYQALLNNIQLLSMEVAKLQKNQMKLCKDNTHMALNVKKWKEKYRNARSELAKKDELISTLQEQLATATADSSPQLVNISGRRSSETSGTSL